MSGKVEVTSQYAYRLLHPMHTVLVSCVGKTGKPNVTAIAWAMPTSSKPPLVAISISPQRHSHTLIDESKDFVINIPTLELLQSVYACGSFSGRSFDKFKKAGLTPIPAKKVTAPAIKECIAHIECTVEDQFTTGDHTVFVGKVVAAYASPGVFTERYSLESARMLYHAGGNNFAVLDPKIYKP
ncbi:MAG: flavin reductase family protein [Candidatus Bathyarchaeota archaeon]|nr:flavin reductase family protein [Candidatus Bathyarchaeota archaeon]